jgi:predicted MFS family arabinose efflux permease
VQAVALLLLVRPPGPVAAAVLVALTGYAFAAFTTPLSTRILPTAPVRVDLAVSGSSTAVNVGITLGALLGSALLDGSGVRSTALAGGLLTLAALALLALDRPRRSTCDSERTAAPVAECGRSATGTGERHVGDPAG